MKTVGAITVVGTSEKMFHAVSRDTCGGEEIGLETTVVMMIVVSGTCSGEDCCWDIRGDVPYCIS